MHQNIKEAMVKATENDTELIFRTMNSKSSITKHQL